MDGKVIWAATHDSTSREVTWLGDLAYAMSCYLSRARLLFSCQFSDSAACGTHVDATRNEFLFTLFGSTPNSLANWVRFVEGW
jgi:hypothetical protein